MSENGSAKPDDDRRFVVSKLDPFLNKRHPDPAIRAVLAMGGQALMIDEIINAKPVASPPKSRTRQKRKSRKQR